MKKIISFTSLIVIVLLSLTGCMTVDYELKINEDGSGELTYVYGIQKEYTQEGQVSVDNLVPSLKTNAEASGGTVAAYVDDAIEGYKVTKKLNNVSEEFSLQSMFGEEYVKDSDENKIKIEKEFLATKYSQKAKIDLTAEAIAPAGSVGMILRYSINLPVKAGENNADEVSEDGKTLTWILEAGSVNQVEFTAQKMSLVGIAAIAVAIIGVVAILAVIILVILKQAKKGKTVTNSYSYVEPEEVLDPQKPIEEATEIKEPEMNQTELKQEESEVNQVEIKEEVSEVNQTGAKEEEPMAPDLKALEEEPEDDTKK